jgi:Mg/Co/Ni transporter MgtE
MKYLAAVLALVALAMLFPLVADLSGTTAILFSFIGMPALALALACYGYARWREGAFRLSDSSRHH